MASQRVKPARGRFGPGRNALLKAQSARGKRLNNLWLHYSPRNRTEVVLRSDVEFDHFCWLEGDENAAQYVLEPEPIIVAMQGEPQKTQFDARVTLRNGTVQLREVKDSDAQLDARERNQRETQHAIAAAAGFDYLRITRQVLAEHRLLIANWRRALAFLAACRSLVLDSRAAEIIARVRSSGRALTLAETLVDVDPTVQPVSVAALLQAVQSGLLRSDLASHPFCARSLFTLRECRHE